jgi:hypothetical protein
VDARISVLGGDETTEIVDLADWLRNERGGPKPVTVTPAAMEPTALGGTVEIVVALVGSGGAVGVLIKSVMAWIGNQGPGISIKVKTRKGSITIKARTTPEDAVWSKLLQLLRDEDD